MLEPGDPYDSDDPLAPSVEKLMPVRIQHSPERSPPRKKSIQAPARPSHIFKEAPSHGDRYLLSLLAPSRPDLAIEGGDKVLFDRRSASPDRKDIVEETKHEPVEEVVDWDEILHERSVAEQEQKAKEEEMKRKEFEREESEQKKKARVASLALFNETTDGTKKSPPIKFPDLITPSPRPFFEKPRSIQSKSLAPKPTKPNGLNIEHINTEYSRPRTETNPDFQNPPHTAHPRTGHIRSAQRRTSEPAIRSGSGTSELAMSSLGSHLMEPPTPDDRLPTIYSPTSPKQLGPISPPSQKLPSIGRMFEIAEKSQAEAAIIQSRQRQQSISSSSAITQPSPTFFGAPSPFPNTTGFAASPPAPIDTAATSPQEFGKTPASATSPRFNLPSSYRRSSNVSDIFHPLHSAGAASETHTSPSIFSPASQTGTSMTTPGEHGASSADTPRSVQHFQHPVTMGTPSASGDFPITSPESMRRASMSAMTLPLPNGASSPEAQHQGAGTYKCDFPGCTAAAFHTQYLLNSHTTVHSSSRPHYCPVQGCARSVTGSGFKRKNEMIRHQLVHESPGYVCPFCPEREHKYPRPDNLQRHVRVHHAEIQTGDRRLRAVLDKRTNIRGTGRRRKGSAFS
ncbi:hypothetical protein BT63DRAFT_440161 [Microthyrium microscopicum]|uniref:C2H2-type domain-containing protein n=1 Tax=Microthyrium microscopicum TaxID=703497 RepID=A0A6A6UD65_9PEZI|nr:hypothetical protein BT63DRAFT_440161 [Microthyrium microscopicum]